MKTTIKVTVLALLAICQLSSAQLETSQDLTQAFDFADNLKAAYEIAGSESKPIMLMVHKPRCPACKEVRPRMIASKQLKEMSKNFVMVHDGDKTDQDALGVGNATYVPRFFFLNSNGDLLDSITNPKQKKYPFYYEYPDDIVNSMKIAIEENQKASKTDAQNQNEGTYTWNYQAAPVQTQNQRFYTTTGNSPPVGSQRIRNYNFRY